MTEPETRRKGARCALIHCLADFLGKRSPRHKSKQGKKPLALLRNAPCGKNRAPKKDCAARFFGKKEPQAPKQTGQETSCPVAKCALRRRGGVGESRTRVLPDCQKAFYMLMSQSSYERPLCGRRRRTAEILDRPSCRLHIKTAVPRLIDARVLPTGKRRRRTA